MEQLAGLGEKKSWYNFSLMNRVVEVVTMYRRFTREDGAEIVRQIGQINPDVDLTKPRDEQYLWVVAVLDSVGNGVWQPQYFPGEKGGAGRLRKMAQDISSHYASIGSPYYLEETGYAWKNTPPVFTWVKRGVYE